MFYNTAGITLTADSPEIVKEGATTASYSIKLDSAPQPGTNVIIDIAPTLGEVTVSPTQLIISDANWNVAQVITVTAIDDPFAELPRRHRY